MDMIRLFDNGVTIQSGKPVAAIAAQAGAKEKTIAAKILAAHDHPAQDGQMHITFDGLISHDITYVGIIQTARASGLTRFPVPYVLTNCHNSLCAVGGTINEDDHVFGLSAAIKYGGDYVPANQAVIHQYAREMMTGCGKMLLGSDSHTRYGAIGTMGIGEGGPELVKQLLQNTYDVAKPQVVLVWLTKKTKIGLAMRAASKDFETAQLMGIKINSVISFTFVVGSALASVGAMLYFTNYPNVAVTSGGMPGLKAFVAAVFGGIGSIPGAVVGAFIIGLSEELIKGIGYSTFSDAFTFALLIVILCVKPTGLFGEKVTDKV